MDAPTNTFPHHEGLNYFAQVPGLVQKSRALPYPIDKDCADARMLHLKASQLRSKLLDWHIRANIVSKRSLHKPPKDASDQNPYYHYDSSTTASFAVNYCTFMILINQILDLLSGFNSHEDANEDLVENIVLSALYCSNTGFCSTQALMQALPIALNAVPQNNPARNDIQRWLKRLSESRISIKWNATFPKDPRSESIFFHYSEPCTKLTMKCPLLSSCTKTTVQIGFVIMVTLKALALDSGFLNAELRHCIETIAKNHRPSKGSRPTYYHVMFSVRNTGKFEYVDFVQSSLDPLLPALKRILWCVIFVRQSLEPLSANSRLPDPKLRRRSPGTARSRESPHQYPGSAPGSFCSAAGRSRLSPAHLR